MRASPYQGNTTNSGSSTSTAYHNDSAQEAMIAATAMRLNISFEESFVLFIAVKRMESSRGATPDDAITSGLRFIETCDGTRARELLGQNSQTSPRLVDQSSTRRLPSGGRLEAAPQHAGAPRQWQQPNNAAFIQPLGREGPQPYGMPAPYAGLPYAPRASTQQQYPYYPGPAQPYGPYGASPYMADPHYRGVPDPRVLNAVPQQAPQGPQAPQGLEADGCMTGAAAASAALLCCLCGIG